ncbi:tripartite tricarboxylate transporter TctB family protein [Roseococcus sp. SDR]|uniref:tripartite tricarboxylate transporter TctB family protein n=1 Tax=Roseococcus sp. SDR TaxID=2835532 RepID=UPI001BCE136C|nr:tripartite tricarboxylate transporter TctB family protein [Roseococcus sp. SDR]MBS7792408.1 tripartite tricarboxylate transporter TctB family protein [Roseococcus sp. SDR]MBV1847722.1 tripartite tricarboxylate transporter TctB family protein [Roseococcus sp. SDR]
MTNRIPLPDLLAGLFVLGFGLVGFWQAGAIPVSPLYAQVGPKAVPYVVASGMTLLGALLVLSALRGGWSAQVAEVAEAGPPNLRALGLLGAGLLANLVLIGPAGFSIAASAQFVLVAAAFGSRSMARDVLIALPLTLLVWFLFVQGLGVNIGAGLLEGLVLQLLGQEAP